MDSTFEKDFEQRIETKLNELGIRTIRNVYVTYGKLKSQIDIMAFTDNSVWCVECKSHNIDRLIFGRSKNEWQYYDTFGRFGIMKSPKKQNENHIKVARMQSICDLDEEFYKLYNIGAVPINNAVVFKGCKQLDTLDWYTRTDCCIYTENNLELLKTDMPMTDNKDMIDIMYNYFLQFQDMSKDREKEHIKYLKECKNNNEGFFSENQLI